MDIIIYNPLSRNGQNPKFIQKIAKKINKTGPVRIQNVLDIDNVDTFIKALESDDRVIIVGGDGTLNRIVNAIYGKKFTQSIFMYRAGTGNDFMRSLKTKKHMVPLDQYIKDLPHALYKDKKVYFLNGAGIGVDGYVGHLINTSNDKKNKLNYFKQALRAFKVFKPLEAEVTVDGKSFQVSNVWLASVMHGSYFGGGMKIAPKANRSEKELYLVLVKDIPKWLLILIFPTIYLGIHVIFKKWVFIYKAQSITLDFKENTHMQIDGEHEFPVKHMTCNA